MRLRTVHSTLNRGIGFLLSAFKQQHLAIIFLSIYCLFCSFSVWAIEYDINGVDDDKLKDNIELHLNNLKVDSSNLTDPFWREQIAKTVATAVQPYGYYNSDTLVKVTKDETVRLLITLNSPLTVANVTREIIGEGRQDEEFRKRFNAFSLKPGDTLVQPIYEAFKSSMFNYALSHGYFDFNWQASRLDLVREQRQANILLIAQSGPRYKFGGVRIVGEDKAVAIIERIMPFEKGEPYSAEKLTEYNRRLNQSGYFTRVIARPVVNKAVDNIVPIEVTVVHKPNDAFNVGVGAATDTGPRVRLRWERPWVNSRGHSIHSELFLSAPEQSLTMDYRIPMQNIFNDYVSIEAGYQSIEYSNTATESETLSLSTHRYWQEMDSPWQQDGSVTYLKENYKQGDEIPRTTELVMPGYAIRYIKKDDLLNVTEGLYLKGYFQIAREALLSDIDMMKGGIEGKIIRTFGKHRWVARAELGAIKTNDFERVPASLRYFAGGDQSIRGFAYRDISPRENVFNPVTGERVEATIGAKYLTTQSIEYAYRFKDNWRAAAFVDMGTASNDIGGDVDYAYGIGPGLHWLSPFGPVRFYIARGFSDFENGWRFHFMLGPEL
ncbi:autotransporter assembly complex protein TamA [Alteromonas sp. ASW11-130]|uniref:autotransporter assembly complex protein TamA n=1 Tax=Alteromonas sp. ASW11-130 TaxID=3015775 RepID=UPI00224285F4|nr:autotransporter assembly complex family protein [Alteromonas sp. ASW11-130]MCW8093358.1 autotransporter assembly complex protein TamA [Alteromonas sp. ASW11-130]